MIAAIREFYNRYLSVQVETAEDSQKRLHLATTALLVEMMRMDRKITSEERQTLFKVVSDQFSLDEEHTSELIALAEAELKNATDYHQFTSLINQGFNAEEKIRIIENLWSIAAADHNIDRYEEHLVRKIAELLYVSHRDFIAAKFRVLEAQ